MSVFSACCLQWAPTATVGTDREGHQTACQCSGPTQSLHLTSHRVSVRGPNQTCIAPHSNQLRVLSGWDITAASQVWSMFWLFLEGWWFGSLRTLCLFFLSKKKKKRNIEILKEALGFWICTRVNVRVSSLLLYTASDPSSWHTIHM